MFSSALGLHLQINFQIFSIMFASKQLFQFWVSWHMEFVNKETEQIIRCSGISVK